MLKGQIIATAIDEALLAMQAELDKYGITLTQDNIDELWTLILGMVTKQTLKEAK